MTVYKIPLPKPDINCRYAIKDIFSTYEAYRESSDEIPFMRGINSIQLMKTNEKWLIINIYWMQESDIYEIPKKYLNN